MSEILPLYLICLVLAYLSHYFSDYDPVILGYHYKERRIYALLVLIVVVFSGLRTSYNDTSAYIAYYNRIDTSSGILSGISWSIGDYPLYTLFNHLMKVLGLSSQSFLMVYSALIVGVSLWFIHKYTHDIILSVFLFFAMGCFGFGMAALKQCAATSFCLIGIDRLLNGKRIRFFMWVVIGALFHPFSAMFLLCPLLMFSPWTLPSFLMIILCALAGAFMQTWLGNALNILSIIGVEYDENNLQGEGVNVFRLMVVWAPIILSLATAKFWVKSRNRAQNLMLNLSTLCAEIMLIAFFGNPVYFGRLANYFILFQTISLPVVLSFFDSASRAFLKLCVIGGYTGFAVYGGMFHGRTFDAEFSRITIWKYLGDVFRL